jgi:hypothetical protein
VLDVARFGLAAARAAAARGTLAEWVQDYLRAGFWTNLGLADGLLLAPRWWTGPFEVPLDDVARVCGPEPSMHYRMDAADWERDVAAMAAGIDDRTELPPLILEDRPDGWYLADGNHRHAALRLRGDASAWVLAWFDDYDRYRRFVDAGSLA